MKKVFLIALTMCAARVSLAQATITPISASSSSQQAVAAPPLALCVDIASTETQDNYAGDIYDASPNRIDLGDLSAIKGNWEGCPVTLTWARVQTGQNPKTAKVLNRMTVVYSDSSNPEKIVCVFSSGIVTAACAVTQ